MIGILQAILCAIEEVAVLTVDLLMIAVNASIVAIGAFLGVLILLLPYIPPAPPIPEDGALGFLNWFIPLGPDLAVAATLITMFGVFMLVKVGLNWMRAL